MVPTRKYSKTRRRQVQIESPVQQAKQRQKHKEFIEWLKTSTYKVDPKSFKRLTDITEFVCKKCKSVRKQSPFSMWQYGKAPKCLTCEFDKKLAKSYPEYKRLTPYTTKVVLKHSCGLEKEYVAETFLRGNSYCDCLRSKATITSESYQKQVASIRNGDFRVEQKYVNTKTPIWHRHVGGCGKRFKQAPRIFLSGTRCPVCETGVIWTAEKIKAALFKRLGKQYEIVKAGKSVRDNYTFKHLTCGNRFKMVPEYLINKSQTAMPCPFCQKSPGKLYEVRRQNKRFRLQGTEHLALDHIISKGILAKDITHGLGNVPKIEYAFDGKMCYYYPDFYVSGRNIIVEAKDINSFGLGAWFDERVFERNCAKAQAVISSGYRFKMLVFNKGKLQKLPGNWWTLSKTHVSECLDSQRTNNFTNVLNRSQYA